MKTITFLAVLLASIFISKMASAIGMDLLDQAPPSAPQTIAGPTGPKSYVLLKCGSPYVGTLWISFGHQYTSGTKEIKHFPSDIVFYNLNEEATRLQFRNGKEAMSKSKTKVVPDLGVALEFTLPNAKGDQVNTLNLGIGDPRSLDYFKGSWAISTPGGGGNTYEVRCVIR